MRVVIAPDKFKGSLPARAVADAIAAGVRRTFPDTTIVCSPVADGGEGTVEVLVAATGGRIVEIDVHGPVGVQVSSSMGWLDDGRAAVEVSSAVGLGLIDRPDPLRASSRGCGDLIARILIERPQADIVVGIGGSASTDGGAGAATALGWRFLDRTGRELGPGGGALTRLATIDSTSADDAVGGAHIIGAVDVDNPLLGPRGSARVFAPQKGASDDDIAVLEEGLAVLADRIRADVGIDVSSIPGGGAAGGIGAGLVAFFGADLRRGFDVVADAIGLGRAIEGADLVITGEGKLDHGTLGGKAPAGVARLAAAAGVPCIAVVGQSTLRDRELKATGIRQVVSLLDLYERDRAFSHTAELIAEASAQAVASVEFP
jgi:glycerate kinase